MQFNRDPPPYPGHSKQLCQPAGFRQSYSGSETSGTDLSMSSTENLALTTRQDPQGEEQLQAYSHHDQCQYAIQLDDNSILARLGLPTVEVKSSQNGSFYVTGSMPVTKDSGQNFLYDKPDKTSQIYPDKQQQQLVYYSGGQANMQLITNNNDLDFSCLPPPPEYPGPGSKYSNLTMQHGNGNHSNGQTPPTAEQHNHHSNQSIHSSSSEISADGQKRPLCRSYEVINAQGSVVGQSSSTRSQPDLSRFKELKLVNVMDVHPAQLQQHVEEQQRQQHEQHRQLLQQQQQQQHPVYGMPQQPRRSSPGTPPHEMPRPLTEKERSSGLPPIQPKQKRDSASSLAGAGGVDHAAMASRALQMVELLSDENKSLRDELNAYHKKISKLQQFEKEIQKVHEAHESLIHSSEKRESLERTMRLKLQAEVTKLRESNKEFSERLEKTLAELTQRQSCGDSLGGDYRQELSKKDAIIAKLVAQNRELSSRNEQLEGDMQLQQSTIQEQRAHIDVLDNALNNAQTNVIRMEEELYRRQYQSERIDQLQKALTQIQAAADKREHLYQELRRKYQIDVSTLRAKMEESPTSSSECNLEKPSYERLETGIRERDTRILELEAERSQWEQRYLQESALRELAIDAASQPKEARIAALEQNSADSERMIAEARSEKMKHLEEVYLANKKTSDLEVRVKTLQAQLAEKDALIRVFQKHSFSTSSLGSVFSTPTHSPNPSTLQLPIHSISTSHSHNHVTNTDTVAASAYMGFHAQTGSSSDCPLLSKSSPASSIPSSTTSTSTSSTAVSHNSTSKLRSASLTRSGLANSAGTLDTGGSTSSTISSSAATGAAGAGAATTQADSNKKPSQSTKQSLLQLLAHKRLHQSESSSRSRSSSQSSTSSTSGLWQV